MTEQERRLALASAEFTSAAGNFAHALLLPDGEHKIMRMGGAMADMEDRIRIVREIFHPTPKTEG